ncbi:protease inhibitor I42 family protein [Streptomyces albidus (ex Kaewkla and Franco 2022)]|uniref:protease inhibitor I42 family protein n=1 Tax=Streptomyces albidus (ex Kaewkla and Franco 2022) TaxID=722709 RepID=UPI0015EF1EB9|nr:protease inhibitor I42 family protein [Streptomyces albidus (ex Kaewkla and Franco 2022)]
MRAKSVLVVLAALAAATLSGCGGEHGGDTPGKSGGGGGGTSDPAPVRAYDKDHTRIRTAPGERFELKLKENPSTGYAWVVEKPAPASGVVKQTGKRFKGSDPESVGSGGTRYLQFRAEGTGRTSVKLRHCFRCGTSSEQTDADHEVTEVTFDVTVQK